MAHGSERLAESLRAQPWWARAVSVPVSRHERSWRGTRDVARP